MKLRNIFSVLFLSIFIYSCGNDDDQITLEETEVSYEIIQEGNFSASIDEADLEDSYLVFKSEEEWIRYHNGPILRLNPEQAEKFDQLSFDFNNNNLIIVTSAYSDSCCESIKITNVYENEGRIYVTWKVEESDNSQEIVSQSYILLKVEKR